MTDSGTQELLDQFYKAKGPCCAGCDHWRWHNSVVGDCTKNAPVSGDERSDMLGFENCSMRMKAGRIATKRDHVCADFIDTYDWPTHDTH